MRVRVRVRVRVRPKPKPHPNPKQALTLASIEAARRKAAARGLCVELIAAIFPEDKVWDRARVRVGVRVRGRVPAVALTLARTLTLALTPNLKRESRSRVPRQSAQR